ncbi:MAG: hypothetical protein HYT21_01405 [Candidatus Nealsonbacteria bacterium]|nr:hypothetical protein [Candidatus Nealsonbacteria bacterium]
MAKKKKKKAKNKKIRKAKKAKPVLKKKKPDVLVSQETVHRTRMRIIGIGGGGSSIVSEIAPLINRVDFVTANTDIQALKEAARQARKFHFGENITDGLGCGMDPRLGQKAAKDERSKIIKLFQGIDLAVIVSSLGGGTGSGAAPEFARIAREMGVLTIGIFTLPFKFEGSKRSQIARSSLERLTPNLNVVSIILNENIFKIIDKNTPLKEAFSSINKRLAENLRGLIEMVYLPGLINIDFADLKTVLDGKGKLAYLNTALASGPNRAEEAVKELLKSPLNEYGIQGAEKIVFNITAPRLLGMQEVEHISRNISDFNRRAKIIFGVSQDNGYKDRLRVTLLAVGVGKEPAKKKPKPKQAPEIKPEEIPAPKIKKEIPKPKMTKKKAKIKIKTKQNPRPKQKKLKLLAKPETKEMLDGAAPKPLLRKNALELRKEAEKTEEDLLTQEKKWDMPAFFRKKEGE